MDARIINISTPIGQLLCPVTLSGALYQGEVAAHKFVVMATTSANDPTPVALSGTVTAKFVRADGATEAINGTISSGKAEVILTQDCYNVPGRFTLSIFVASSGVTVCSCAVTGNVLKTTTGTVVDSGSTMPDYTQVLAVYDDMQTATTAANNAADAALSGIYAAEAVAQTYDGAVILPCDDQKLSAAAYIALPADKHGMLININGASTSTGPRLRIYGMGDESTGMVSTNAPTYANRPEWYFAPCTAFTVGHTYAFDVVVVSGSVDRNGIELDWYIDLRNNTEDKKYSSFNVGTTWECTFLPEMVCFGARQYIYNNAVLWLKITDVTAQRAADPLATDMADAQNDIADIRTQLDAYGLPDYWLSEIATKADELAVTDFGDVGSSVRFAFVTDVHVREASGVFRNQMHTPGLLAALRDLANIDLAFFGGDAITGAYASKAASQADLLDFKRRFSPAWSMLNCVFGNHDYGNNSNGSAWTVSNDDMRWMYNILIRDKERNYASVNPVYGSYVLDDAAQNVRFIAMNENHGGNYTQQPAWLSDRLLETPTGYTIIIISHRSLTGTPAAIDSKLTATNSILPVATAYNARETYAGVDFSGAGAKVACIIGGHCHYDDVIFYGGNTAVVDGVYTGDGIPVISTTCDFNSGDIANRPTGTTNEQAFDVVMVNTSTNTIQMKRIGYGASRIVAYN